MEVNSSLYQWELVRSTQANHNIKQEATHSRKCNGGGNHNVVKSFPEIQPTWSVSWDYNGFFSRRWQGSWAGKGTLCDEAKERTCWLLWVMLSSWCWVVRLSRGRAVCISVWENLHFQLPGFNGVLSLLESKYANGSIYLDSRTLVFEAGGRQATEIGESLFFEPLGQHN